MSDHQGSLLASRRKFITLLGGGVAGGRLTADVNRGGALAVGLRDSLVVQEIARMGNVAVNKRHVHSMA